MSESLILILVILRHAPGYWMFPLDIHAKADGKLILGMIPMHCGTLEGQGYITSRLQAEEDRKPGRMYAITPRGRQRLIEAEYQSRHPDGAKPAT